MKRILVVGAGFSGAVVARAFAENLGVRLLVVDVRSHTAGNCHTERDDSTGVMLHRYGPHIFNTSRQDVWDYVNHFGVFHPFINRIKAVNREGVFSLPINLHTINQVFGKRLNPAEAREFISTLGDKTIGEPQNFEEQALKMMGRRLYDLFFYGYTKKQWGCEPTEIPASVLKRLPIRFNYDDNYYNQTHQGIPVDGYTAIVERILDHPCIEVKLGVAWEATASAEFDHVIYTGPIDGYYRYHRGRLNYRTVTFERIDAAGDFQGNAVINYTELDVPHTRIHEHKHFTPWETHEKTVAFRETSKATSPEDLPYYPVRKPGDLALLAHYRDLAEQETKVSFLGRLATYRYLDMHVVIGEALDFSRAFCAAKAQGTRLPVFPAE